MSNVIEYVLWYGHKWGTLGLFVIIALSLAHIMNELESKND